MTKYELIQHLANLTIVFEFHEKLGTTKNPFIMEEFKASHDELTKVLEKEQKNETGKSEPHQIRNEDRANLPRR